MALTKIKVPLPKGEWHQGDAELLWAEPKGPGHFQLKNVPTFAKGISFGDTLEANVKDNPPIFTGNVSARGGHSTYRIYATKDRHDPRVLKLLEELQNMHCEIEVATDTIIGVDVLPEADIYAVYDALEKAEQKGFIDFDEGHCGHKLKSKGRR